MQQSAVVVHIPSSWAHIAPAAAAKAGYKVEIRNEIFIVNAKYDWIEALIDSGKC